MAGARMRMLSVTVPWAAYALVATGSSMAALLRPPYDRLADLHVYYGAVHTVASGMPLYSYVAGNGDPFTYPPFALIVFWPIGWLPEAVVRVVWLALTGLAVAAVAVTVARRWPPAPAPHGESAPQGEPAPAADPARARRIAALAALGLIVSAPVQSDLRFGQVSVFVTLAALVDALGPTRRWRGVLVGLAAAVKLTPLLFVAYFLLIGDRRAALRAAATFGGAAAVAALLLPGASWTYWTGAVFTTSRIGDLATLGNQSLRGVLLRAGLPDALVPLVWLVLVALICAAALLRARRLAQLGLVAPAAVLVGCATVAASPVSWTHHQVWTVLAGMLLAGTAGDGRRVATALRRAAGALVLVTMTLSLGDLASPLVAAPGVRFLFDNARGLAAAAVCVAAFGGPMLARRTALTGRRRTPAGVFRPALAALAATLAIVALLPLPERSDPSFRTYTAADVAAGRADDILGAASATDASHQLFLDLCGYSPVAGRPGDVTPAEIADSTLTLQTATDCSDMTLGGQMPWPNYNEEFRSPGTVVVSGQANLDVTELDFEPGPGGDQRRIALFDLPGHRAQGFVFCVQTVTYARLVVYGPGHAPLATTGLDQGSPTVLASSFFRVPATAWQGAEAAAPLASRPYQRR